MLLLLGTLMMLLLLLLRLLWTVEMLMLEGLHRPGSGSCCWLVTGMLRWAWHRCCCSAQPVLGQELVARHAQLSPPGLLVCNSRHSSRPVRSDKYLVLNQHQQSSHRIEPMRGELESVSDCDSH